VGLVLNAGGIKRFRNRGPCLPRFSREGIGDNEHPASGSRGSKQEQASNILLPLTAPAPADL
jgi:hypothetical protein